MKRRSSNGYSSNGTEQRLVAGDPNRVPLEALFARAAATILVATALTKLLSLGTDSSLLAMRDPLLRIRYDGLFLVIGIVEILVAWELWRAASRHRGLCWLFCLSVNFILYRMTSYFEGTVLCPCLGTFAELFGISSEWLNFILFVVSVGMCGGSAYWIWQRLRDGGKGRKTGGIPVSHESRA